MRANPQSLLILPDRQQVLRRDTPVDVSQFEILSNVGLSEQDALFLQTTQRSRLAWHIAGSTLSHLQCVGAVVSQDDGGSVATSREFLLSRVLWLKSPDSGGAFSLTRRASVAAVEIASYGLRSFELAVQHGMEHYLSPLCSEERHQIDRLLWSAVEL